MVEVVVIIRASREQDLHALVQLFTESVHGGAATHYDELQRTAWAPLKPDLEEWRARFSGLRTLVAEENAVFSGFLSYADDGHIALLYTAPDRLRSGIASALYAQAERELLAQGACSFFTEASLLARPFFECQGFHVVEEQRVVRRGVAFRRFLMRKDADRLGAPTANPC